MAVGKASVTVSAEQDGQFGPTFDKSAKRVKAYVDTVNKDLKGIGNGGGLGAAPEDAGKSGWLAGQAKKNRLERRRSGESALGGALNDPMSFALQSVGMGVQGMVVDKIGESFGKLAGNIQKVVSGEASADKMIEDWARGLPILGGFVTGWQSVFSLASGTAAAAKDYAEALADSNRNLMVTESLHASQAGVRKAFSTDELQDKMQDIDAETAKKIEANTKAKGSLVTDEAVEKEAGGWQNWAVGVAHRATLGYAGMSDTELNDEARQRLTEKTAGQRSALDVASKNIYKAAEEEKTNTRIQVENKRASSILGIERNTQNNILEIQRDSARTGEATLAAQHESVKQKAIQDRRAISLALKDPKLTTEQRTAMYGEINSITAKETSDQAKLDYDEGKRKKDSMLGIEKSIAGERLSIQRSNAHDASALWEVKSTEINAEKDSKVAAVNKELERTNLTVEERIGLEKEKNAILEAGAASIKRAREDYEKDLARSRASTGLSLLGMESNLLGKAQSAYGGNSPEAIKMQKKLDVMQQSISMKQSIQGILDDPKASAAQKDAAKQALGQVDSWAAFAGSDKETGKTPYQPLRFASAEDMGGGRVGARAAFAAEKDSAAYAKANDATEARKRTNDLLTSMLGLMQTNAKAGADDPLFPP